jgi:hypothetical protein
VLPVETERQPENLQRTKLDDRTIALAHVDRKELRHLPLVLAPWSLVIRKAIQ